MITVFGSINLDMIFTPPHLPAPGETVLCELFQSFPGGKGANQAVAAARAGAPTRMVGCVGNDSFADLPLDAFREAGVDITHIARGERPTGCATISVDPSGANQIVVASGANREVKAGQLAGAGLGAGDILLLQMEIDLKENWLAVKEAAAKGVRILLNNAPAAPLPAEILGDLSLLIVNEIEVMQAAAERGLNADDPLSAARMLHESYGLGLIVTLGGDGSLAITADGSWQVPAPTVEVIDTVGAGDAFTGAFAAALENGHSLPDCLAFASAAGGLACRRHGAQASLALQEEIEALAATLLPRVTAI